MKRATVKATPAPRRGAALALFTLGSGAALPHGDFVALIPGADAPLLPVDLPSGLKGEARRRVAHRQITDQIGPGVGPLTLRPMPDPGNKALWRRVLVAPEQQRRAWRADLAAEMAAAPGGTCRAILPDYLALPAVENVWTVAWNTDQISARLGPGDGFTAEMTLTLILLRRALTEAAKPRAVYCITPLPPEITNVLNEAKLTVITDPGDLPGLGLNAPVVFGHGELALDLAQDAEADLARLRRTARPWVWALLLGALGLGFWTTAQVLETRALRAKALAERRSAEALARADLIPSGPILDLRLQIEQRLAALETAANQKVEQAPPLAVLRRAADVLTASGAAVQRMAFRPGSGLLVDLELDDFAALDRLAASLRGAGVPTTVAQSVSRDKGTVAATLQLGTSFGGRR